MTLLLRKMCVQTQIGGRDPRSWSEDHYAVVDGETRVGRIYKETIHGEPRWLGFLQPNCTASQSGHGRHAGGS